MYIGSVKWIKQSFRNNSGLKKKGEKKTQPTQLKIADFCVSKVIYSMYLLAYRRNILF